MASKNQLRPTLNVNLSQRLAMTPSLLQKIELLTLNQLELSDLMTQELVKNPFLEEVPEGGDGEREAAAEKKKEETPEHQLSPFGYGNPVPLFSSEGVAVGGGPWILKEKHLKWRVRAGRGLLDAIWWRRATAMEELCSSPKLDLAYTLSKDSYLGEEKLLLTVKDIKTNSPSS